MHDWKKVPIMKTPRQKLIAKLDNLVSLYVRMRDSKSNNGLCRICNKWPIVVAYHIIPRGKFNIRWDLDNVIGACIHCNFGEKNHRLLYRQKHIEIFGKEKYENLEMKARQLTKFSNIDLLQKYKTFKSLIENFNSRSNSNID